MDISNYGEHLMEYVRDTPRGKARAVACLSCDLTGTRILRDHLMLCTAAA